MARTATLVQRVLEEVAFVKATRLVPEQMASLRSALIREFETNSQDNGFLLDEISPRYDDGGAPAAAALTDEPQRIAALTAEAIQRAAQVYLDTTNYVTVTQMPESR